MPLDPSALALIRAQIPPRVARVCAPDREGLHKFCSVFWRAAGLQGEFVPNWHTAAICEALTRVVFRGVYWAPDDSGKWRALCEGPREVPSIESLVINTPPGSGKTLTTEVFLPAWVWTWDPGHRFIFTTFDTDLCHQEARRFLRLVQSPLYRACYPHVQLTQTRPAEGQIETALGGVRITEPLGGGITGRHAHTVIGDDLVKPDDAARGEIGPQLDRAWELWSTTYMSRSADASFGAVMIGQRLAEGDPPGRMLDQGAEHVCITARYEPDCPWDRGCSLGHYDPRTVQGESFFPARFPESRLEKTEMRLGPAASEAQLQQNPTPKKGAYFQEDWFRTWDACPPVWELEIVQSWDLGFSGSDAKNREAASRVHGALWARQGQRYLLLDEVIGTWNYPETKRAFVAAQGRLVCGQELWHRASCILLEAKANGSALQSEIQDDPVFASALQGVPVIPITPQGSKEDRAARHSAKGEAGLIWLPPPSVLPSVGAFIGEHVKFPKQKHNDRVDTTTQALDRLSARGGLAAKWLAVAENT